MDLENKGRIESDSEKLLMIFSRLDFLIIAGTPEGISAQSLNLCTRIYHRRASFGQVRLNWKHLNLKKNDWKMVENDSPVSASRKEKKRHQSLVGEGIVRNNQLHSLKIT